MIGQHDESGKASAGQGSAGQDRAFARYIRRQVAPYSPHYGPVLDRAGQRDRPLRSTAELGRLPFTTLDEVSDPAALVLRPDEPAIARSGDLGLITRVAWARLARRQAALNRSFLEPAYKPVHWQMHGAIPIGYSFEDLNRLAESGRRWLELAGVERYDVVVSILPPGPTLPFWQLAEGTRRAGLSTILLPPVPSAATIGRLGPTVLAGRPSDLVRVLEQSAEQRVHHPMLRTLLSAGELLDSGTRDRLRALAPGAEVLAAWAPPGVRSLWAECRGADGFHTWPEADVVEIIDPLVGTPVRDEADGEVVWSALGWKGSVLLRLRTGAFGSLHTGRCPACGRDLPRLRVTSPIPAFAAVLDGHADVESWQAELRTVDGSEELIVFLAPSRRADAVDLVFELDDQLSATQFVVLDRRSLDARLAAHGDERVVDLRQR